MAKLIRPATPTSVVLRVKLMDSTSTAGAGKTGLTSSSSGLIISTIQIGEAAATAYTQAGSTIESIATLGTYAAPTATKCRFKEVDATNHPGVYEVQFADARFASTIGVIISISGVTGLAQGDFEIQCENIAVQVKGIDANAITATAINSNAIAAEKIASGAITSAKFAAGAIDAAAIATDAIGAAELSAAACDKIWAALCSNITTAGSIGLAIKNAVGYTGGAVYYDNLLGAAGAVVGVNGTIGNPCSAIANAITIAVALKIKIIRIGNGCTVTLGASMANYTLIGENWTLALNGQAITNAMITGAIISGTSSGKGANFYNCLVGTATIDESWFFGCAFNGTLTTVASGNYLFKDCTDGIPGTSNPTFTLTASAILGFRGWTGGVNVASLASTNDIALEGYGRVILLVSCAAAGTVRLRGNIDLVDQVSGGFVAGGGTLLDTARFNMDTINELGNKTVLTRNANGHPLTYQVGKGNNLKTVTATYVSAGGEERADTETVA